MTRKARHQIQQKHFKNVMFKISEMQEGSFLSDLKLKCEDKEFFVHKLILSASSPFFQEYFTTNSESGSFEIDFLNSKTLETVLIFIYEGRINVTKEVKPFLKDLVEASRIFQMPLMYNYCLELILDCPSPEQLLSKWNSIEELGSDFVMQTYLEYLHKNLETLQTKENFLELDLKQLNSLLSYPVDKQEDKILSAILLWVKYNKVERANRINDLLKHVDFAKLSNEELLKLLDEPLLKDNSDFIQYVHQLIKESDSQRLKTAASAKHIKKTPIEKEVDNEEKDKGHDEIIQQKKRQTSKKSDEKVQDERDNIIPQCIICYDRNDYMDIIEYDFNSKTWMEVKDECLLKWIPRHTGFATCSVGNSIYFFGGAIRSGAVTNCCFVLDLIDNKFTQIASMKFRRYKPKAVKLHHFIYVIGGCLDKKCSEFPEANERYNISTQQWETVKQLPYLKTASDPLVVAFRSSLFAVAENALYAYYPADNTWYRHGLPFKLFNFCPSAMIEENGKIIIFGYGTSFIFVYDPSTYRCEPYKGKEINPINVTAFSKTKDKIQFFVVGCKESFLYSPPDSYQYISTVPFKHPELLVIEKKC